MYKSWFIVMLYIFLRIINMDRACLISIVFPQNEVAITVLFFRQLYFVKLWKPRFYYCMIDFNNREIIIFLCNVLFILYLLIQCLPHFSLFISWVALYDAIL